MRANFAEDLLPRVSQCLWSRSLLDFDWTCVGVH